MDLKLLRYVIDKNNDTMEKLSEVLNIHYNTLSLKLNGKRVFTQTEIKLIKERYNLTNDEVVAIFF